MASIYLDTWLLRAISFVSKEKKLSQNDEQEQGQAEQNGSTWIREKLKKIHWYVHSTFPNVITSPHGDESAYFRERDEKKNSETRLPEGEDLRVNLVWGVEIFGPSEIISLYSQLEALGWASSSFPGIRRSATEWIKEARTYGYTGNFNIGRVTRNDEPSHHTTYTGPIPKHADYLLVNITQISPTITCVLVGFVLTEEFSRIYERILTSDRKTQRRPIFGKFTYRTLGVELLKRESIDEGRSQYREMVIDWFAKNLSGFFHSTSKGRRLPTTELITSKNALLLNPHGEETDESKWARLLIPFGWGDVWISAQYNGLRLRHADFEGTTPFHTIVTLQTAQLPAEDFEIYGGQSRSTIAALVHESLDGILGKNASLAMLQEISRTLTNSREKLRTDGLRYKQVLQSVEHIKSFFDRSLGIPVVVADLHKKSENSRHYEYECHKFENRPWHPEELPAMLSEVMRLNTKRITERVLVEEAVAREHFEQIASILSTRESVKTQRRMEYLTVLTIFLALGSLMISLSPDSWLKTAKAHVEYLLK